VEKVLPYQTFLRDGIPTQWPGCILDDDHQKNFAQPLFYFQNHFKGLSKTLDLLHKVFK
jgi:hypothetical protein